QETQLHEDENDGEPHAGERNHRPRALVQEVRPGQVKGAHRFAGSVNWTSTWAPISPSTPVPTSSRSTRTSTTRRSIRARGLRLIRLFRPTTPAMRSVRRSFPLIPLG